MDNRTAIVIGYNHPVVGLVTAELASRGNHIVLIGVDDLSLLNIARSHPTRIETLSLSQYGPTRLAHLRDSWGDTPIHSYVDMSPCCNPTESDASLALSSLQFLAALKAGLRNGAATGAVVCLARKTRKSGVDPLNSLMARVRGEIAPAKIIGTRLRGYDSPEQHRAWARDVLRLAVPDVASSASDLGWNPNAA